MHACDLPQRSRVSETHDARRMGKKDRKDKDKAPKEGKKAAKEGLVERNGALSKKFKTILREVFDRSDADKDGALSLPEFSALAKVAGHGDNVSSEEFAQLNGLKATLDDLCAEPSRTGMSEVDPEKLPSRRRQIKQLRNELRATLANVDAKLADDETEVEDPVLVDAIAKAQARMKLPKHLRGSAVLAESI